MELNIFTKNEFDEVANALPLPPFYDSDYVYEVYELANEGIKQMSDSNLIKAPTRLNDVEIIYYCLGEYLYSVSSRSPEEIERFKQDENIQASMASVVADKYLSLSMFNHVERKITNRYLPPISSLNIYVNFMLNILNGYKKNDPQSTLITDLLIKSLSITRCIISLLVNGYETEAFASWRTLHECESTLVLLERYGDPLINTYLKHMEYGIAFKNGMEDKEKQDATFYRMKDEMRELGLKSKDIKKYIEYGFLYNIPGVKEDETFKLNFRDGLERLAGLSNYNKIYELSSEIIHSTPILIYSNKEYFYFITLLNTYESFFRLEHSFLTLFSKRVSQDQMRQYLTLKSVYFSQLVNIHKRELESFKSWQKQTGSKE